VIAACAVAALALVVIAWLCARMARLHEELAGLNQLVADMLRAGDKTDADCLAEAYRDRKLAARRRRSA
jgi:hypothetical protein